MNKRTTQRKLLFHPAGECTCQPVFKLFELTVDRFNQFVILLQCGFKYTCKKINIFTNTQIGIERKFTRHITKECPKLIVMINCISAKHAHPSAVRFDQGSDDPEQSGFTGTIRANKSKE